MCCCLVVQEQLLSEAGSGLQVHLLDDARTSAAIGADVCCLVMPELICSFLWFGAAALLFRGICKEV